MKSFKTITVTLLIAFGLTGCYTQLQYSQGVSSVTDEPGNGYTQNGESEELTEYYQDEGYIPVYYKDYGRANWWASCCNPYAEYSYGTSYYYNNPWYDHYSRFNYGYAGFYSPFHFSSRWKWRHFGLGFHHNFFAMNLYWGSPYYSYSGFLYGPWAGYYHHRPYRYGHGYYYGHDGSKSTIRSRSYRPRSIGTNRVANSNNRSEERTRSVTRQSSSTQARGIRSTGSTRTRTRGAVQQGTTKVQQPRTRGTNRSGVQTRSNNSGSSERSRGTIQRSTQSKSTSSGSSRTRGTQRIERNTSQRSSSVGVSGTGTRVRNSHKSTPMKIDQSAIRSRISRQRAAQPKVNRSSSNSSDRTSFFGRVKKVFNNSTLNNSTRIYRSRSKNSSSVKSNNVFRQRTRTRSTSISRPKSTNRSSVTRSRSSSSSRSRGTSSSSRSSSSRSRGN